MGFQYIRLLRTALRHYFTGCTLTEATMLLDVDGHFVPHFLHILICPSHFSVGLSVRIPGPHPTFYAESP